MAPGSFDNSPSFHFPSLSFFLFYSLNCIERNNGRNLHRLGDYGKTPSVGRRSLSSLLSLRRGTSVKGERRDFSRQIKGGIISRLFPSPLTDTHYMYVHERTRSLPALSETIRRVQRLLCLAARDPPPQWQRGSNFTPIALRDARFLLSFHVFVSLSAIFLSALLVRRAISLETNRIRIVASLFVGPATGHSTAM